jgi:hypothetical protein
VLPFAKLLDSLKPECGVNWFELTGEAEFSRFSLLESVLRAEITGATLPVNILESWKLFTSCKGKDEYMWSSGEEFNFSNAFWIKESKSSVSCISKKESIFKSSLSSSGGHFSITPLPAALSWFSEATKFCEEDSSTLASVADNSNRQSMAFSTAQQE